MVLASAWPYLQHSGPLAIAHRGGAAEAPENTMAAFEHARNLGYKYLELDVRATVDNVLAVYHDPTLDTLTDKTGKISEVRWEHVKDALVDGEARVPRLEEVLDAWDDMCINIDPKHPNAVEPLVKVLRARNCQDRVCLSTFSDRRTLLMRRLMGSQYCTATTLANIARIRAMSLLQGGAAGEAGVSAVEMSLPAQAATRPPASPPKAGCAQVPVSIHGRRLVDERFVSAMHSFGLQVHVWTINDPAEMHELLDIGVDGIMTDRPSLLKRVLQDRKSW